ncbi:MAG: PBP1A family penicillin-binding protein, partial [Proteobacteria bacterium]|nr:PBP1A family penicillin-binding protein [Pseudomonadota bacterium]
AFVAAEDNKFWKHDGIDYTGMARALFANVRAGHSKEGASTITQQVVKTFFLTPEKTFKRKVQEIILARRVESKLTKNQILNLYLNQIYFGRGRYGVEEAARYYFGKGIADVNVGEAALLAGLPKSPEGISPSKEKNRERAKERQSYVLNQLVVMGKITTDEAMKWKNEPIKIVKNPFPEMNHAPEWIEPVTAVLEKEKGKDNIDTLGAKVRTTLDPAMQEQAQRALQAGLRAVDKRHGIGRPVRTVKADKVDAEVAKLAKRLPSGGPASHEIYEAVVLEAFDADDEVLVDLGDYQAALVLGGPEDARFNTPDADGNAKKPSERFKRGDVVQVVTMSMPKAPAPVVAGVEEGDLADPAETTPVAGAVKHAKHRVHFSAGPEGAVVIIEIKSRKVRALVGGYTSKVAGFDRALQAKRQPGSSFKPFVYATAIDKFTGVKLGGKYTAGAIVNDAPEVFDLWKPKNYESGKFMGPVRLRQALAKSINTVAIHIGYDVTPEAIAELANKMGIESELPHEMSLALGAVEVTPLELTNAIATFAAGGVTQAPRFVDAIDGKPMPASPTTQALRPEVAYVVTDMMRSVVEEGTAHLATALGIPIAGKTGTSNDARDTWFVGLTPDYAIGVWVGFDDNRPMGHEAGGTTAVPIFVDVVKTMKLPKKAFPRPAKVVEVSIDKATGLLAPEGAPKGTTMMEVFVEGTVPTETAAKPGEITDETAVKSEYDD